MSETHTPGSPPSAKPDEDEGVPNFQSTQALPPIAPGFVRPLTDPEAVERWRAMYEEPIVEFEYNPLSNDRIRS
jgi:hypothetical protein